MISIQGFTGPRGLPIMIFDGDWRAASCLLLTKIHAFASGALGDGPLCASIPHRDAMLIFRDEDAEYRAEICAIIAKNEGGGPKPLTNGLFRVLATGVEAMT